MLLLLLLLLAPERTGCDLEGVSQYCDMSRYRDNMYIIVRVWSEFKIQLGRNSDGVCNLTRFVNEHTCGRCNLPNCILISLYMGGN
jgi:hypothetical protein